MSQPTDGIVELDVRPHLRKKLEPFQIIMDTVKTLKKEDTFILHATFKPTPLLGLMRTKGYVNAVTKINSEHWTVTFVHKSQKHKLAEIPELLSSSEPENTEEEQTGNQTFELDNRGLEPPQPMIRTLSKLGQVAPGDTVVIHNDRVPMFLIEELNTLGYKYSVAEQEDGTAKVTILKK